MSILERVEKSQAKRIYIFENGNSNSVATEVTISPLYQRTWNKILQHISEILKPHFNVVHRLVSVKNKKCSLHSFTDLTKGEIYVACGKEKLNLKKSREFIRKLKITKEKHDQYANNKNNSLLSQVHKNKITVIYVFTNGYNDKPPVKFVLTERDLLSWTTTLTFISKMLDKPEGIYIYTVFGRKLKNEFHLNSGRCYVAVGNGERFQHLDYSSNFQRYMPDIKKGAIKRTGIFPNISVKDVLEHQVVFENEKHKFSKTRENAEKEFIMKSERNTLKKKMPLLEKQYKIDLELIEIIKRM